MVVAVRTDGSGRHRGRGQLVVARLHGDQQAAASIQIRCASLSFDVPISMAVELAAVGSSGTVAAVPWESDGVVVYGGEEVPDLSCEP